MIRTGLVLFVACLFGLFLEGSVIHTALPLATAPDFILILVVLLALHTHSVPGVLGAFALGLFADFASGKFVGPNAAGCVVAYCLVSAIASRMYADKALAIVLITFLCSVAKSSMFALMQFIYVENVFQEVVWMDMGRQIVWEAVLTALLAPVLLKIVHWGRGDIGPRQDMGSISFGWWH